MKLKLDVQKSTMDGMISEIKHKTLEMNENGELLKIYEQKCDLLIKQLSETTAELNENKRRMIGFTQSQQEKDEKIDDLRDSLNTTKIRADELHLQLSYLTINHEKIQEQVAALQITYDDTVDKLHKMNKARHDLETKLTDEIERNRSLQDIVRLKEESIIKRQQDLEDLDRKIIDLERVLETVEIKKQADARQFELTKKQLTD